MFYKSKVFLMVILFMLAMILVGCNITVPGEPSAKVTITSVSGYLWQTKRSRYPYYLTMNVTPTGSGTVSPGTGPQNYLGPPIDISAIPNSGFEFDFWVCSYGSISDLNNQNATFTMGVTPQNIVIVAHFKAIEPTYLLTIKVDPEGSGTVVPNSGEYICYKDEIDIKATPESGFVFVKWEAFPVGYVEHPDNVHIFFYMPCQDTTLTAYFKAICVDGETPYIGEDGHWWIGTTDTGVPATGEDGNTPEIIDGYWWIDGVNTGVPATGDQGEQGDQGPEGPQGPTGDTGEQGEPGCTPVIIDGYWWICNEPTGIHATGPAGADGADGADGVAGNTPYIQDGTWWIDGVDTGVSATGDQGEQGDQGPQGPQGPAGQDCTLPDSIYVYYTIENTGNVDIQEYTIYFDAETNNGVYTGIATGEDLAVGITVYSYIKIDVFGKEVTFIDYSLELK